MIGPGAGARCALIGPLPAAAGVLVDPVGGEEAGQAPEQEDPVQEGRDLEGFKKPLFAS